MSVRNIGKPQVAFLFAVLLFMSIFLPTAGPVYKIPSSFFPGRYSWEFVAHGVVGVCRPALQIPTLFQTNTYKANVRESPSPPGGFSPSRHEHYQFLT